jgi:hypothetical protein
MSYTDTQPIDTGELDAFTDALRTMAPDDIRRHATQLHATDELDWWQTTLAVERLLRDAHLARRAARAARAARDAVLATVTHAADEIDGEAIAVARAASDAARALFAGCHLTDANSFAVGCEPVAPSDPNRATGPSPVA